MTVTMTTALSGCTWNPACYLYVHAAPFLLTALCLCPHLWQIWRLRSKFFDLKLPRSCGGTSKWLELGPALGRPSSLGWARVCSELFNSSKFEPEPAHAICYWRAIAGLWANDRSDGREKAEPGTFAPHPGRVCTFLFSLSVYAPENSSSVFCATKP